MNNYEIDKGIKEIFELLTEINIYIDRQAPWTLKKNDIRRMNEVLTLSVEMIKRATFLLYPIIPKSCLKIFNLLNIDFSLLNVDNFCKQPTKPYIINKSEPIFPRIEIND